MLKFAHQYH